LRIRSSFTPAKRTRASLIALAALAAVALVAAPLSAAALPLPGGESPYGNGGQGGSAPVQPGISQLGTTDGSWYWERVDGANRYEVAVNLYHPFDSAEVIYIASGEKFADALSAGPAAFAQNGGLLLTAQNSLPDVTRQEIIRLHPQKLVVVGGTASVSDAVFDQLAELQPDIIRIGGADRFEVSRNIVDYAFGDEGVSNVFVATGNNFPDALAAGPAAAHLNGAVLLVNGWAPGLDEPTRQLLSDVHAQVAGIAGGVNSVNATIEADLIAAVPSVTRYTGADRFEVAASINLSVWNGKVENAFIASGLVFPDALSSGPVAASFGAPLFLAAPTCYPAATADAIWYNVLNPETLVYVGGPNTLSQQLILEPAYC
jgi:putative cell wall-binding protein